MPSPFPVGPTSCTIALVSHQDRNLAIFRRELIQALTTAGARVIAVVPQGPDTTALARLGVEVRHYPFIRGNYWSPWAARTSITTLKAIFAELRPDLIHSFTHQPNLLTRLARPRNVPVVNSVTGLGAAFISRGLKGFIQRFVVSSLYLISSNRCQAIIFQNDDDRSTFRFWHLTGGSLVVTIRGSGVDLARFRPSLLNVEARYSARATLGLTPEHVVVTMAGRLLYNKGIRELLLSARALANICRNMRILLVGDIDPGNPHSLIHQDLANISRLNNIILTGWQEDMPRIWWLSDIAVLPSYREGLPVSLQEALASGLPVVTTTAPGCRDVGNCLENETAHALLVPPGQWLPLAYVLYILVKTPALRTKIGAAARRKAEHSFNATVLAAEHLALYLRLLKRLTFV
ncbi:putative galactosyltransferase [Desulfovibrionales bacterium]